jgi:hypothetical protein
MIKQISYKGKKYPIRIGYKALKGVNMDIGRDFKADEDVFDYEGAEALLFHGLKQGCKFADKEFDLKRDEMEDVLEESLNEFITAFTAFSQDVQKKANLNVKKK